MLTFPKGGENLSLTLSLLLVKGDIRPTITELFAVYDYTAIRYKPEVTWDEVISTCWDSYAYKAITYSSGWTFIYDPEMVLFAFDEESAHISRNHDVCSIIIQGTSDTYGFNYYQNGQKTRSFLSIDGDVVENLGECLSIEQHLNLQEASEDTIFALLKELKIDFDRITEEERFILMEFA